MKARQERPIENDVLHAKTNDRPYGTDDLKMATLVRLGHLHLLAKDFPKCVESMLCPPPSFLFLPIGRKGVFVRSCEWLWFCTLQACRRIKRRCRWIGPRRASGRSLASCSDWASPTTTSVPSNGFLPLSPLLLSTSLCFLLSHLLSRFASHFGAKTALYG